MPRFRAPQELQPLAVVGGHLCTDLVDVTSDLSALDSNGFWAVVLPFDEPPICARFATIRAATPWPGPAWRGPSRADWQSTLSHSQFTVGVDTIRKEIAAGSVYQVNLTRRLSAPLHSLGVATGVTPQEPKRTDTERARTAPADTWRAGAGPVDTERVDTGADDTEPIDPEPIDPERAPPESSDVAALGAALAVGNPAPFSAVVRIPSAGLAVASASPERFLAREGDRLWSSPIKGTAATVDGFLPKDRAENVMIVDLVRNDLGRVCEWGSVRVSALLATEPHPGLYHLVSTVEGQLRPEMGWADVIGATFPPGSVTGAPKIAAMKSIARLEPTKRGIYCGAIGWVDADAKRGDLNVAIRTFWIDDGHLHFGTGGGITYGSDPEGEWAETELKAANLLTVASRSPGT